MEESFLIVTATWWLQKLERLSVSKWIKQKFDIESFYLKKLNNEQFPVKVSKSLWFQKAWIKMWLEKVLEKISKLQLEPRLKKQKQNKVRLMRSARKMREMYKLHANSSLSGPDTFC